MMTVMSESQTGVIASTCSPLFTSSAIWPCIQCLKKRVSYTVMEDGILLQAHNTIMLSRRNSSLTATLRRDTRIMDLFNCIVNCVVKLELEYSVQFHQLQRSDIACDMQSFWLIQDVSHLMCCRCTYVAKLYSCTEAYSRLQLSRAEQAKWLQI